MCVYVDLLPVYQNAEEIPFRGQGFRITEEKYLYPLDMVVSDTQ
jgi:hypothetical protein